MKQFLVILLIAATSFPSLKAHSQSEKTLIDNFIARFNKKMDTVQWLCDYDKIAWWTSDSVYATSKEEQAKLGSEWFCFKTEDIWHAVYGKYSNGKYDIIYHYTVDTNDVIKRVYSPVDSLTANSFCRALVNGTKELNNYPDSIKVRFNQYIRRNSNGALTVWFLPAFTTNGVAVYGGEFCYLFDSTGNTLVSKIEYSQGYKGYRPDKKKEIWLDYSQVDEPTLGSIFFVWYYRTYFDRIIVDAKKFKSTVFHDEKGYYWVHGKKD